jgi:DNA-binding transcriptional MerR regulator
MRITDAARVVGATPRALRWYEQHGLIHAARTPAGYRDYSDADLARVRNIRTLLGLGFTLEDIATFGPFLDGQLPERFAASPGGPCEAALARSRERLATLDRRIAELTGLRDRLAASISTGDDGRTRADG